MDGNGRWATQRQRPRALGHRMGVLAARRIVQAARQAGVEVLTLFAFSQENWRRPPTEVRLLIRLFGKVLRQELASLHANGVQIRFIGDHRDFPPPLLALMREATQQTAGNRQLILQIALGYGGQWDIAQAASAVAAAGLPITVETIEAHLATADLPPPDLLIRTGGEQRLSNFLIWQSAYAELYFSDVLWPDFDEVQFHNALSWYSLRERRFGGVPAAVPA